MKRIITILLLLMPITAAAQQLTTKEFLEKYLNKSGFTSVELTKEIFQTNKVTGIDSMVALSTEDGDIAPLFTADVKALLSEYKRIMSMVSDGKNVSIHSKSDSAGKIYHLAMFSHSEDSAVLILLSGSDIQIEKAMSLIGNGKK